MNKKSVNLVIAGIAPLLALLGCSRGDRSGRIEITLVAKAMDSEFWQSVKSSAEEAARKQPGVTLAVLAPAREINIDQQVSILEDQVLKKVAALVVAPAGGPEVIPVLDKARAAGIPVIIVDTDINWPPKLSYVGTDNQLGGRLAGEYLVKTLGGKGKVAVIRGVPGVETHEDRVAGFLEAISAAPGIECVAVQPANSERAMAMTVMENLLTSHPDLRAVFATSDQMALGAIEGVSAHGLTGRVILVGFDATEEEMHAIQAGRLTAAVAQHPELMGRRAVEEAIKAVHHQPVEKRVDTGTTLVTRENVGAYLR